ncbi:MAG: head-tail adaptor protein [Pseudomonadota bacterium]|nr:head-tail adaptor protein [Pseudomonadota bacterium]MEC7419845.1 head-tail adaptor protein [Pseudomonadota bacterium]MEC8484139.1 head-tail adaptor protein [Pseudomonadota bacterium]
MRTRERQRLFDVFKPTVTRDSYGQAQRTYQNVLRIAGKFETGSSSKGELAEVVQGTQVNNLHVRYVPNFTFTLDMKLRDLETQVEYKILGLEDVNSAHNEFVLELQEVVE